MQKNYKWVLALAIILICLAVGSFVYYRSLVSDSEAARRRALDKFVNTPVNQSPTVEGKTVEQWIEQLKTGDIDARNQAVSNLGRLGANAKSAVPELANALKDTDKDVRINAAAALERLGPVAAPAVPALIEALKDTDPVVIFRTTAASALAAIGSQAKDAVPALIEMTKVDNHPHIVETVRAAIQKIDPDSIDKIGVK